MRSHRAVALLVTALLAACAGAPPPAPEAAPAAAADPAQAEDPAPPPAQEPPRLLSGATPLLGGGADPWDHGWARGAVFYEVFVPSFEDSDGDGVGDLQGLTSRLDDLNDGDPATDTDLEVDALWLTPAFEAPAETEDLQRLLEEAHRRGMRVIVGFGWDPRAPDAGEEMKRLADLWLGRGLDGFVVEHRQAFELLSELGDRVRAANPRAVLVGKQRAETPAIARGYASLPVQLNFPLAAAIVEGVEAGEAGGIAAKLREMAELYPPGALDAPFLTNHEMPPLAARLGGDPRKLRAATAVLLTLPGAPFLSDAGVIGPGDDPRSLPAHGRRLIRARKSSAALREGSLTLLTPREDGSPVLAFLREHEGERVLAVHNLGPGEIVAGPYDVGGERLEPIFLAPGTAATPQDGGWKVRLPAGGSLVVRVQ